MSQGQKPFEPKGRLYFRSGWGCIYYSLLTLAPLSFWSLTIIKSVFENFNCLLSGQVLPIALVSVLIVILKFVVNSKVIPYFSCDQASLVEDNQSGAKGIRSKKLRITAIDIVLSILWLLVSLQLLGAWGNCDFAQKHG